MSVGALSKTVTRQVCLVARSDLRQDPFEAILVILVRRALIFLFEISWKNLKNDATFVRMRSGNHLGDEKNVEKSTSLRRI